MACARGRLPAPCAVLQASSVPAPAGFCGSEEPKAAWPLAQTQLHASNLPFCSAFLFLRQGENGEAGRDLNAGLRHVAHECIW